ncbi:acyltransferase [Rhodococcus sp. BP-252]|uniref:Acyltransferase n=1 Tax=Rhodococcoides kyotonense TaxID=398843 RepID=A0A177Y8V5_9NOCA|nr:MULTISPECIES: acyltransferase [Rhodococcus]MBY6411795.1 acyltransferase [Rhodococcus sp. BP-320]MBY6416577.1 acyltransferase [Rhodococcus sp. BP-321]MBY6420617.1 acyltransferase [Rhodococcus sp. BP-324]MBY6426601.1 acyltransferase [Rhodococcus sp. BP-323]MBY6431600.1 acyltransferase [Rhodococcus sp. BP-322]
MGPVGRSSERADARPSVVAPRVELAGADLLRTIAVFAVLYSHISFYLIDDRGEGWWVIDVVYATLVQETGLNQHLSFVGVAIFMLLTGLLVTRSAMRQSRRDFAVSRLARLLPALWVSVAAAIVLVRLGINGMFSGQNGISNSEAALSFVLGGFFLKPEVAVLGVTWTLTVQLLFYLYCSAVRGVLRRYPVVVPLMGAALCVVVLLYNFYIPQPWSVPMLSKIAATLPTLFLGQIIYLGWARIIGWRWVVVAVIAQAEVVRLATDIHAYWAGDKYMWTIVVVTGLVLVLARYDGRVAQWEVVRWIGTRSYAIYLVHTLILYRVYENVVPITGPTGAVVAFVAVTAVVSEAVYRWVETPAARWLNGRLRRPVSGNA